MRIAIVGSRDISLGGLEGFHRVINIILPLLSAGHTIVSGGADGIDSLAEGLARGYGNPVLIIKPEWSKYGKSAGFKRNQKIVDTSDAVVAFLFNDSPGTSDTIRRAQAAGKPLTIYRFTKHPGGGFTLEKEEAPNV